MYIKSSLNKIEEKVVAKIEEVLINDNSLTGREKVQAWIWLYSSIIENRFSNEELINLTNHVNNNPHFFKDLIMGLSEVNHLIKTENKSELLIRLKESIDMIEALKSIS